MGLFNSLFRKKNYQGEEVQLDPRQPRIQLLDLHNITFHPIDPPLANTIYLLNLSTGGVGLMRNSLSHWPKAGSLLKGMFRFEGEDYPVTLRMVHLTHSVVGCSFQEVHPKLKDMIHSYFDIEFSAIKLVEKHQASLPKEESGKPHCYLGLNNCELFFVTQREKITRFNLSFFANYIEGGENTPTRFGVIVKDKSNGSPAHSNSALIQWNPALSKELILPAVKFIRNIQQLSVEHQTEIIAMIKRG